MMTLTNWPWWLGAIAFASLVLGYYKLMGHPLGASGSYARVADAAADPEEARRTAALADPAALEAALRAATEEQFGAAEANAGTSDGAGGPARGLLPWTAHLTFLAMMIVGGLVASLLRGGPTLTFDLGAAHASVFGQGWKAIPVLVGAGLLIGFGTRMAGGCSSGHGLSGCARLQPGSMVATAAFFGAGVGVSMLIAKVVMS